MFPFAAPLQTYKLPNNPMAYVTGGFRNTAAGSTMLNLAGAAERDYIVVGVFSSTASIAGGAGVWTEITNGGMRVLSKRLQAADLLPGALTCGAYPWAFGVWRRPLSQATKGSGSNSTSTGVVMAGFTKNARSAGLVTVTLGANHTPTISGWTKRQDAFNGANNIQLFDKASSAYTDGTSVTATGQTGSTTQAVMLELLNTG